MTAGRLAVAAVQMTSSDRIDDNLELAAALIGQAAGQGAVLVVLPENFAFMGRTDTDRIAHAEADTDAGGRGEGAPLQAFLAAQAACHGIWLVGGTIPLRSATPGRVYSGCLCYAPDGRRAARYDKIHLFDVDIPGGDGHYRESASTVAGNTAVIAATPFGGIGLAVCYDLRFPELFRLMSETPPALIALCSAFTRATGAAHWDTLVRARAIENLTAVVAASQGGDHTAGRQTWGHSMIVDAWGTVLAERADPGPGVVTAEIDLVKQTELRDGFPALSHRRGRIARAEEKTDVS